VGILYKGFGDGEENLSGKEQKYTQKKLFEI